MCPERRKDGIKNENKGSQNVWNKRFEIRGV